MRRGDPILQIIAFSTAVIAGAIIVGAVYVLRKIVAIFALSFLLAYIVSPLVNVLERRNLNRGLAIAIVSVLLLGLIGSVTFFTIERLSRQVANLTASIPEIISKIDAKLANLEGWVSKRFPQLAERYDFSSISELVAKLNLSEKITPAVQAIVSSMGSFISIISAAVIIPFLSLFMLVGGRSFRRHLIDMVPNRYFEPTLLLLHEIDRQLGRYLRGRALETAILSVLAVIGLGLLRVRFYGLLGVFAGVMNLIPYVGPVLGAIPACILILVDPNFKPVILVLAIVFFFVLQLIDNFLLFPLVVGRSMEMGPIMTVFVLLVSAKLFGFLGLIIGLPAAAALKAALDVLRSEFRGSVSSA